jgi:mannose-6-phosphate isomerase-like protein (cupin superfamily)
MSRFVIAPGAGRSVWLGRPGSIGVDFKLDGDPSDGRFSVIEHPIGPGTLVPPHIHTREDEFSFVLQGEIGARIGDEIVHATPGSYIIKPRNIWHTFWNAGPEPARIIEIISPAGFEKFFAQMAELAKAGPPTPEALDRLASEYGLSFSMDWVPELKEKYNLMLNVE